MRFHMYRDEQEYWRWRLRAVNGRIIADSAEGYHNRLDCRHAIELVMGSRGAEVVEE
ncbi:MAG: DUF1508 domain-containing protein [Gemmatimonadaceae bacterium]